MNLDLPFRLAMQDQEIAKSLGEFITKKKVRSVKGLQTDYLRKIAEIKADKVYEMVLEDNEIAIFHFEVQRKKTHRDMALRMFDYITRIVSQSGNLDVRLYSVVIYLGEGAGADDTGVWTFGNPVIGSFQYIPLKLWQLDGDIFLEGDNLNLLAFLPQMKLLRPKEQLQAAMQRITTIEDKDHVAHLLYTLATLTEEKGLQTMVDVFISEQEMLEAPDFIRNAYLKARDEGLQEGKAEGLKEGEAEGLRKGKVEGLKEGEAKGREEGEKKGFIQAKIDSLLKLIHLRFDVPSFEATALQAIFSTMDRQMLDKALEKAIGVQSLDDMKVWLSSPDA